MRMRPRKYAGSLFVGVIFAWIEGFYKRTRIHPTLDIRSPKDSEDRNDIPSLICQAIRGRSVCLKILWVPRRRI